MMQLRITCIALMHACNIQRDLGSNHRLRIYLELLTANADGRKIAPRLRIPNKFAGRQRRWRVAWFLECESNIRTCDFVFVTCV